MNDSDRSILLGQLEGSDTGSATNALLSLTYGENDIDWIQDIILGCISDSMDRQVRELAVICLGHVARLYGSIRRDAVTRLNDLMEDSELGGFAEDALDDIASFSPGSLEFE